MTDPIMVFKVFARQEDCSNMTCRYGRVTFIPFTATVESELFSGETDELLAIGRKMQETYGLIPENTSKYSKGIRQLEEGGILKAEEEPQA